jgi:GTP-binding protein
VGTSRFITGRVPQPRAAPPAAPGKTRLANFFRVQRGSAAALFLVDLPGYGYARGGDRSAEEFRRLTEAYFDRPGHRAVLLLVDARHPGLDADLEAWAWLRSQPCPSGVIGTKVDKLTRAERARHARELESSCAVPVPLVSAHTGEGLDQLWTLIARIPTPTAA